MIDFEDYKKYGAFVLILISLGIIIFSGIFMSITYYSFDQIDTAFRSTDCVIDNNTLVSSCQELWGLALYPFLALKEILIWFNIFLIFGLVLGMLFLGYQSGRNPIFLGITILLVILMTYLGLEVSNIYRGLLDSAIFRNMLLNFAFYNKVMLKLPWFIFIVGLASTLLGIVNFQKTRLNKDTADDLDY